MRGWSREPSTSSQPAQAPSSTIATAAPASGPGPRPPAPGPPLVTAPAPPQRQHHHSIIESTSIQQHRQPYTTNTPMAGHAAAQTGCLHSHQVPGLASSTCMCYTPTCIAWLHAKPTHCICCASRGPRAVLHADTFNLHFRQARGPAARYRMLKAQPVPGCNPSSSQLPRVGRK
jgi:hypothetical protein